MSCGNKHTIHNVIHVHCIQHARVCGIYLPCCCCWAKEPYSAPGADAATCLDACADVCGADPEILLKAPTEVAVDVKPCGAAWWRWLELLLLTSAEEGATYPAELDTALLPPAPALLLLPACCCCTEGMGMVPGLTRRDRMLRSDIWRRCVTGGMRASVAGRRPTSCFMSLSSSSSWFSTETRNKKRCHGADHPA